MARERLDPQTLSPLPRAGRRRGRSPRVWPPELVRDVADRLTQRLTQLRARRPVLFSTAEGVAELAAEVGLALAVDLVINAEHLDCVPITFEVLTRCCGVSDHELSQRLVHAVIEADTAMRVQAAGARVKAKIQEGATP